MKIGGPNGLPKCPESRELVSGHFWETFFWIFFEMFESQISTFFENMDLRWPLREGWTGSVQRANRTLSLISPWEGVMYIYKIDPWAKGGPKPGRQDELF